MNIMSLHRVCLVLSISCLLVTLFGPVLQSKTGHHGIGLYDDYNGAFKNDGPYVAQKLAGWGVMGAFLMVFVNALGDTTISVTSTGGTKSTNNESITSILAVMLLSVCVVGNMGSIIGAEWRVTDIVTNNAYGILIPLLLAIIVETLKYFDDVRKTVSRTVLGAITCVLAIVALVFAFVEAHDNTPTGAKTMYGYAFAILLNTTLMLIVSWLCDHVAALEGYKRAVYMWVALIFSLTAMSCLWSMSNATEVQGSGGLEVGQHGYGVGVLTAGVLLTLAALLYGMFTGDRAGYTGKTETSGQGAAQTPQATNQELSQRARLIKAQRLQFGPNDSSV